MRYHVTMSREGARLAAELCGEEATQAIQLDKVYAPEPLFDGGTRETSSTAILNEARQSVQLITTQREVVRWR
jgi:hypothetical protein